MEDKAKKTLTPLGTEQPAILVEAYEHTYLQPTI